MLAATRRSVCIHQINRVNTRSDHGHEDSTINIVVELLLLLIIKSKMLKSFSRQTAFGCIFLTKCFTVTILCYMSFIVIVMDNSMTISDLSSNY